MRDGGMNILLAHGSPDPRHREQAALLASRTAAVLGDEVQVAFLDDMDIPRGGRVLPLFLGEGRHAGQDAARFAQRCGGMLLPPLAEAAGRLAEMGVSMAASMLTPREPAIFAFYRFRSFERLLAGVYAQRKRLTRMSMASLHGAPSCADMLRFWEQEGAQRLAVQPMLLFAGQSLEALTAGFESAALQVAWGEPLGAHADMPRLVADRLRGVA
jgi:sirohydrochlorin ferrochelatase